MLRFRHTLREIAAATFVFAAASGLGAVAAPAADECPDLSVLDLAPDDAARPVGIGSADTMLPPVEIDFVDAKGAVAKLYGWGRLAARLRRNSGDPRRDFFEADFTVWVTAIRDPAAPRVRVDGIAVRPQASGFEIRPSEGNHTDRVWIPLRKAGSARSRDPLPIPQRICLKRDYRMGGFVYRSPSWECAPTGG